MTSGGDELGPGRGPDRGRGGDRIVGAEDRAARHEDVGAGRGGERRRLEVDAAVDLELDREPALVDDLRARRAPCRAPRG